MQPNLNETEAVNDLNGFQVVNDLPVYDQKEREQKCFEKKVFKLQSTDGDFRYKLLPVVVKFALLAQTNAGSEWSLPISARIITQKRIPLGENDHGPSCCVRSC